MSKSKLTATKKLVIFIVISAGSPNRDVRARHHDYDSQKMGHSDYIKKEQNRTLHDVETEFQKQLTRVYQKSIGLKKAYLKSDPFMDKKAVEEADQALQQVNRHLLAGDSHMSRREDLNHFKKSLEATKSSENIEMQCNYFAGLNRTPYQYLKSFGIIADGIYYQYCLMALEKQGAYRLIDTHEIRNPYVGDEMLTSGSVEEIIEFKQ